MKIRPLVVVALLFASLVAFAAPAHAAVAKPAVIKLSDLGDGWRVVKLSSTPGPAAISHAAVSFEKDGGLGQIVVTANRYKTETGAVIRFDDLAAILADEYGPMNLTVKGFDAVKAYGGTIGFLDATLVIYRKGTVVGLLGTSEPTDAVKTLLKKLAAR